MKKISQVLLFVVMQQYTHYATGVRNIKSAISVLCFILRYIYFLILVSRDVLQVPDEQKADCGSACYVAVVYSYTFDKPSKFCLMF